MLVPLDQVLFGRNPPAGMDFITLGNRVYTFRKTAEPCNPPILVTSEWVQVFRVHDGRHRVFGAIIAGRSHIEAQLLQEKP